MFGKFMKTILGIFLIPVAVGAAKAFYSVLSDIGSASSTLITLERGVLVYLAIHVMVFRPAYLYVLAHEMVHVVATWLCGGKVVSFNVTPRGGNVVTSKTNAFIELSPYFVPMYTILLVPLYYVFKATGSGGDFLSGSFVFFVGLTLAFHFVMTSEVMRMQQSDIEKSGLIFSLIFIFVGNLIVTMAVFCPIFQESFVEFIKNAYRYSMHIYTGIYRGVSFIVNYMLIWQ